MYEADTVMSSNGLLALCLLDPMPQPCVSVLVAWPGQFTYLTQGAKWLFNKLLLLYPPPFFEREIK